MGLSLTEMLGRAKAAPTDQIVLTPVDLDLVPKAHLVHIDDEVLDYADSHGGIATGKTVIGEHGVLERTADGYEIRAFPDAKLNEFDSTPVVAFKADKWHEPTLVKVGGDMGMVRRLREKSVFAIEVYDTQFAIVAYPR